MSSMVDPHVATAVHALYARQSHLIDGGDAAGWAGTFTADGVFASPSYPAPVEGADALTAFAERFAEAGRTSGDVQRHVVTTVDVVETGEDALGVRAYLQIVGTRPGEDARLVRLTTLHDRLVRDGDGWLVARRDVVRDHA
ncbi:nuclear transport factor 2 family protein [Aeromicrobium sp. IC_218]|uniref:nuclear transport factor 2 family protein n=1 Tax=Aeromicrobium sp. IC_218 TaxID=2545468 RepID=UPI00103FE985|nr:nuclear transport factor 2 family protein [Aeromicrobium sp. IC_218]TCI99213.1 nuclear transport factor 2 family protein [Aeromicrobium sp. IC_218]